MGIIAGIVAVAGAVNAHEQQKEAAFNAKKAAGEQKKSQAEQRAMNAQQQAEEKRKQVREERVRKARIMQSAENTGVAGSSGEMGAVGGINTQAENNIGINIGRAQAGDNISGYMQNAADFNTASQQASFDAQNWSAISSLSGSIFTASGGFDNFKSTKAK